MSNIVTCPSCGHQFSPDDLLTHEIEIQLRSKLEKELFAKAKESNAKDLLDREEQIKELQKKVKEAEESELSVRKDNRQLKEAEERFRIEATRQLDLERNKIKNEADRQAAEKNRYELEERDKKIKDMQKALEEIQRKGSQGSQQLQGEVLELDVERDLRQLYPNDQIVEVAKGREGADIKQEVKTQRGTVCGVILWEVKQQKSWQEKWLTKLKEDMRRENAHLGAIVTTVLPRDTRDPISSRQNIWVLTPNMLSPLSQLLRKILIDVMREKVVATNKQGAAENLYDYVNSNLFTSGVERMVRAYLDMKATLAKEQAVAEKMFKQRNIQIDQLISSVAGIYGEIQGLVGSSLPSIPLLEPGDQ